MPHAQLVNLYLGLAAAAIATAAAAVSLRHARRCDRQCDRAWLHGYSTARR